MTVVRLVNLPRKRRDGRIQLAGLIRLVKSTRALYVRGWYHNLKTNRNYYYVRIAPNLYRSIAMLHQLQIIGSHMHVHGLAQPNRCTVFVDILYYCYYYNEKTPQLQTIGANKNHSRAYPLSKSLRINCILYASSRIYTGA